MESVDDLVEESNVRGILDSYVYPPLDFGYYQFKYEVNGETRWIGVFRIMRTGRIHEVDKEMRDGKDRHLAPGESWTRRGSTKTVLNPKMKDQLRSLMERAPRAPVLKVLFHRDELVEEMDAVRCDDSILHLLDQRRDAVRETYQSILEKEVREPLPPDPPPDGPRNLFVEPINLRKSILGNWSTPVEVEEETMRILRAYIEAVIEDRLDESFFDLGRLVKERSGPDVIDGTYTLEGTDDEKEKYGLIQTMRRQVLELLGLTRVFDALSNTCVLPVALSNVGTSPDEGIRVLLRFPKGVEVLGPDDLPMPTREAVDSLSGEDGILRHLILPVGDDRVQVVDAVEVPPYIPGPSTFDAFGRMYSSDDWVERFERFRVEVLGHKRFVREGGTVVEVHLTHLKHNETVVISPQLLVRASETFTLSYEVTSHHHPDVQKGSITYHV